MSDRCETHRGHRGPVICHASDTEWRATQSTGGNNISSDIAPLMQYNSTAAVSVVLPTREWTVACDEMAAQTTPTDEFFVVCD